MFAIATGIVGAKLPAKQAMEALAGTPESPVPAEFGRQSPKFLKF